MLIKTYTEIPTYRPYTPLLNTIDAPHQLKNLPVTELKKLADELRHYLLYTIGCSGGHFGANLGVVELTVALHMVMDTPHDRLIWDVGHQAYGHKVLTGRREQLLHIRSKNGLTGFPERKESEYDCFGVGHSSTSISAAVGMALALRHQKKSNMVTCVIGDGAMTAGMAFEAINDAIYQDVNILIIFNDNNMSISNSVGGLTQHISSEDNNFFERLGVTYHGPVDGHDIEQLISTIDSLKKVSGVTVLHIHTTKGKGFKPAERDPIAYHAISKLQRPSDNLSQDKANCHTKKYSAVFGEFICDTAKSDDRIMAITPAMSEGSGMVRFAETYPSQFFDVAIAEQHAVTLAAGMACENLKPIVAIYSTFLQRGFDQLIHDVALQNLDVTFAIDRAGLVGEDGATHAGVFDYAFMRCIPNIVIMAPKDENECYQMLHTAYEYKGVTAVRYPRGLGPGSIINKPARALDIGTAETLLITKKDGKSDIALLAFGSMVTPSLELADKLITQNISVTVVNMRFIKPLDTKVIADLVSQNYHLVTIEEHMVMGGAGSAVNEYVMTLPNLTPVLNIGIPDRYIAHASQEEQMVDAGLDRETMFKRIMTWLDTNKIEDTQESLF